MKRAYDRAWLCAFFCGWLLLTGCQQLASMMTLELTPGAAQARLLVPAGQTATPGQPVSALPHLPTQATPAVEPPAQAGQTPTETPVPPQPGSTAATDKPANGSAVAPLPVGTVAFYEDTVTLPTYPRERYQSAAVDPTYHWPYQRFDVERFRQEAPTPTPRTYRLLVLENSYLKVIILPELGGRIWQVIHKPSGAPMFYQNQVVKPTHWGIEQQKGWLALGGLEWSIPVIEHGYDWGTPWAAKATVDSADQAAVTVSTPRDGRLLSASITISLRAGAASFEITPTLTNLSAKALDFSFWHDAMLAPGSSQHPSAQLHFVLPSRSMTVHSTNDAELPPPGDRFSWPIYANRDFSRLGNFRQYLGFFEAPAAHGPFVGIYDPAYDAGAVRIFPAATMQGSKVFALGWQDAIPSDNFTDDDSMYVELHGGLAPTFRDQYQLPGHGAVSWRELWYPVTGIGDLTYANEVAALAVKATARQLSISLYPTRPLTGQLVRLVNGVVQAQVPVQARPDAPYHGVMTTGTPTVQAITTLQLQDSAGRPLLTYQLPQD